MVFLLFFFPSAKDQNDQSSCYVLLPFLVWSFFFVLAKMQTLLGVLGLLACDFVQGLSTAVIQGLVFTTRGIRVDVVHGAKGIGICVYFWINVQSLNTTCTENLHFVNSCRLTEWFYICQAVCMCVCSVVSVTSNSLDSFVDRLCILQAPLVHGILQARIVRCIAMPSLRSSSRPRIDPGSLQSPA